MSHFRTMRFLSVFVSLWSIQLPTQYGYRVVKTYPHDRSAFTQGLEYRDGFLFEGTGMFGRSSVRKVDLDSGRVIQRYDLPKPFFGEGITVLNQQILELTWQSQTGFVYDKSSFRVLRSFNYPGEGWGLTNDGKQIYMSDGSADSRGGAAEIFKELRPIAGEVSVTPVTQLT